MLCAFVADRRRQVQPLPDIQASDSLGRDLIKRAYADSTRRNLNSHIKIYLTFCEAVSSALFQVTVKLITRYIAYLVSLGHVYGTILYHLSSIKHMHKFLGHDLTWDSDKLLLRGVKRYLGTAVQRKAPINPRLSDRSTLALSKSSLTCPLHPWRLCSLTSRKCLILLVNKLFCPNIVVCV